MNNNTSNSKMTRNRKLYNRELVKFRSKIFTYIVNLQALPFYHNPGLDKPGENLFPLRQTKAQASIEPRRRSSRTAPLTGITKLMPSRYPAPSYPVSVGARQRTPLRQGVVPHYRLCHQNSSALRSTGHAVVSKNAPIELGAR